MSRRSLLLLVLLAGTPAPAAPPDAAAPAAKRPTPAELRRFRAALRDGQTLEKRGDHAAARKALEAALAVLPGEPQALDELGVVAFRLGDLPAAEQLARQAAETTSDARQRARALFNLGRVQEARGEKDKAIDSYRRSLADRPNATVRGRLAALDPAAVPPVDALAPQPMAGPFASLRAWCDRVADCSDGKLGCDEKGPALAAPPPPVETARVVWARCTTSEPRELTYDVAGLALRAGGRWYVTTVESLTNDSRNDQSLDDLKLEARPLVPGGPPRVTLRYTATRMYRGMDASAEQQLVVAAVGPSGRPSISGKLLVEVDDDESDEDTGETRVTHGGRLDVHFLPGDVVEVTGPRDVKGRGIDPETLAKMVGRHPLVFP